MGGSPERGRAIEKSFFENGVVTDFEGFPKKGERRGGVLLNTDGHRVRGEE